MRRRLALVVAAVCGLGAILLAALPYTGHAPIEVPAANNEPPDEEGNFLNLYRIIHLRGRCQPLVISSWRKDGPEPRWAVTVDTNMIGPSYGKADPMGSLCAHSARRRLVGSLALAVLGVGAMFIGRRSRLPGPPQAKPAGT